MNMQAITHTGIHTHTPTHTQTHTHTHTHTHKENFEKLFLKDTGCSKWWETFCPSGKLIKFGKQTALKLEKVPGNNQIRKANLSEDYRSNEAK